MYSTAIISAAAAAAIAAASSAASPPAADWEIGPVIRGKNYSQGMPRSPEPARTGWFFDFPAPSVAAGHIHYVTFRADPASIVGKSRIVVRYRIDAAPGTRFVPRERPGVPATVSLYLQRRDDNWTAKGRYEFYRWYAPAATVRQIAPGEVEMRVRLDDPQWGSVQGKRAYSVPSAMPDALANIDRVGLVFGSAASGRGHGVYATAPARFTLLAFRIE